MCAHRLRDLNRLLDFQEVLRDDVILEITTPCILIVNDC